MNLIITSSFLVFVTCTLATSLASNSIQVGEKFLVPYKPTGPNKSEGIKRQFPMKNEWQYFYFCGDPKIKKPCGAWLDEKGNKVNGANNNVKKETNHVEITKAGLGDAGIYLNFPENPDGFQAYLERLEINVNG